MSKYLHLLILLFLSNLALAQKGDTLRKYLNEDLSFTSKDEAVFPALAMRFNDHWLLYSVYQDTNTLLKIFFKDRSLTIKDGPYDIYHPKKIKGLSGMYLNNVKHGTWISYYENGQARDSGVIDHNRMTGTWYSWHPNGHLMLIRNYPSPDNLPTYPGTKATLNKKNTIVDPDTVMSWKEGLSIQYYNNGQIQDSGIYHNNQKQGIWKNWHINGQQESTGSYVNGSMEGEWQFFRENGVRSTIEKYSNNKIADLTCFDSLGQPSGFSCSITKPPVPQGKFSSFQDYALDNIFWPPSLPPNISGVVTVKYTVTKEGKLKDFKVVQSPHPLLSKEVERFLKTLEWSPAISHNRAIDATMDYEVPFFR
ncbi:MAG: energy transducer TonB [Chitinophagaceae bacterium]